jgi:alcohol dehydrogenase (cytochrome c)
VESRCGASHRIGQSGVILGKTTEGAVLVTGRWLLVLLACLLGCARLNFLKPPSVPRPKGESQTLHGPAFAPEPLRTTADPTTDWSGYNNGYRGNRFSPLAQITRNNVDSLREACTFELEERAAMESGPVVVDGTLFVTTAENTYALDAATCALRWKHTYRYSPSPPFDLKVNRGVAYLNGRLFRGANDGRVYALDAWTGKELWNVAAGDPSKGETFPAAPVAWRDLVFIGNAGGDNFGVTGRMMAFNAETGGRVWSFDLVPESDEAARSWPAATETVPKGGAASWTSYALDTLTGTVYVPTGNAAPDFLPEVRPGENLYAYSVVALDAHTGAFRKHYPILARDFHDWDVAAAPALITTGDGHELLLVAGKDGHVYGIERASARRRYTTRVTTINNVTAPFTAEGTRFCPGVNGGVEWNGPAYSPRTNMVYVNAIDWCTTVRVAPADQLEGKDGLPWTGASQLEEPFGSPDSTRRGWLTALDAEVGRIRWQYSSPTPLVAGITATAGGLVFTADLNGDVLGFDAENGRILWRSHTGQPVGGGVVSYAVGGRQFIAVASGLHAPVTWQLESTPAKIVVFALGSGVEALPSLTIKEVQPIRRSEQANASALR